MEDEGSYSFKAIVFIEYHKIFQIYFLILSNYQYKRIFIVQIFNPRTLFFPSIKKINAKCDK